MGSQATKVQAPPEWKRQFGEQQAEIYASEISQIATNPAEMRELMGRVTEIATGGIGEVAWDAEAILALAPGGTALRALLARRAAVGATEGTAAAVGKEALARVELSGAKAPGIVSEVPQITINRQNGAAFECQVVEAFEHVGGTKNTVPVTVQLPNGAQVTTIPDLWGRNVGGLLEVKNVQNLSMSNQLRAQVRVANETGQPLNLVVSPRTNNVSGELVRQVRSTGGDVYRYNPATGDLTKF